MLQKQWVMGKVGIQHEDADKDAASVSCFDGIQWQPRDVDQQRGALDIPVDD